jgi:hypothetical protein
MPDVLTNRASLTLAAAITSATQTSITRTSAANGLPGDSNGPASGTYKFVMTDGNGNYELAQVTGGQGTTTLTIARAVELIGGVQTALASVPSGTVCYAVATAGDLGPPFNAITIPATYAWSGPVLVPSGATGFMPPLSFPVPSGQSAELIGVFASIRSGTSVTLAVNQNGSAVSGLSALVVTTTGTYTAATTPPSIANNDQFAPVVSAISGTPDGLSLTLYFQITL